MRRLLTAAFCMAAALALATPARAADFFWTANNGAGLSATALFSGSGTTLTITLTNTSSTDVSSPSAALTALLFNCNCGTLTPVSATTSGAVVQNGTLLFGGSTSVNVGGEWGFGSQTDVGSTQVITSMGGFNSLGTLNSGPGNFNGSDLDNQAALDGVDFGIVTANDDGLSQGSTPPPLIRHDVIFVFSGYNGANLLNSVTNVSFQYGTATTETRLGGGTGSGGGSTENLVPEPTSLLLFGSGLAMTAYRARRKKNQKNS